MAVKKTTRGSAKPRRPKAYWEMEAQELAAAAKGLESLPLEAGTPLSDAEHGHWEHARRRGRPPVGKGAVRVFVSIERDLLKRLDDYARAIGVGRSRVIAEGLNAVLPAPTNVREAARMLRGRELTDLARLLRNHRTLIDTLTRKLTGTGT